MSITVREDDLTHAAVQDLLALHLRGMRDSSPPGGVFALDLSGLRDPAVTVFSAWDGDRLAGIGALKALGEGAGEIKSMRTHPDHLRRGVGARLLDHIIARARSRGLRRLSLETGSGPAFEPALALYRRRGFVDGGPYAAYEQNRFSRFLHLSL